MVSSPPRKKKNKNWLKLVVSKGKKTSSNHQYLGWILFWTPISLKIWYSTMITMRPYWKGNLKSIKIHLKILRIIKKRRLKLYFWLLRTIKCSKKWTRDWQMETISFWAHRRFLQLFSEWKKCKENLMILTTSFYWLSESMRKKMGKFRTQSWTIITKKILFVE